MPGPQSQTKFVVGASLLVMLCTAILVWTAKSPLMSHLPIPSGEGVPYQAFVIFREADCEGNLSFAQVFQRPRFSRFFHVTGVVLDAAPDTPEVRSRLKLAGVNMRFAVASPKLRQAVAVFSSEPGPLLIIVDHNGRLRLITVTPKSPAETRQFAAMLSTFTAAEQRATVALSDTEQ